MEGISSLLDKYDGFIVDLWGVVCNRNGSFPYVHPLLEKMKEMDKAVFFLSNSPHRMDTLDRIVQEKFKIHRDLYYSLFSSGESMYESFHEGHFMERYQIGHKCFVIDTIPNVELLNQLKIDRVENFEDADFILALDILENQESMHNYDAMMKSAIAMDIPMVCGNIDRLVVTETGETLYKPGELAFRYQQMGGVLLHAYGKPHPYMFKRALKNFKSIDHDRIVMVGDGLTTDIMGANSMNLDCIFIQTGIHHHEIQTPSDLPSLYKKYHAHPTFCAQRFCL